MKNRTRPSLISMNFKFLKYTAKLVPVYFISGIINVIANVINAVIQVKLIEDVVREVTNKTEVKKILLIILYYAIIIGVCKLINILYNSLITPIYQQIYSKKMQTYMYSKVKQIDIALYDDPEFYDRFSRGLTGAIHGGFYFYGNFVRIIESILISIALGTYIITSIDGWLVLIVIAHAMISTIMLVLIKKYNYNYFRNSEKPRRFTNYVQRIFYQQRFMGEIKTTNVGKMLINKYDDNAKDIEKLVIHHTKKICVPSIISSLSYHFLCQTLSYVYLVYRLFGGLSVALFTANINSIFTLSSNIQSIGSIISDMVYNSYYVSDFLWLLDYKPNIEKEDGITNIEDFSVLKLNDVTFAYPKTNKDVLNKISLKILKNQKIAIVGDNGSGKTTLTKLLFRFYDASSGEILYNKKDIKNYNSKKLREKYAIVYQDFQIYSVSIAENVLMRKCNTKEDEEKVINALKLVNLYFKVENHKDGIYALVTREFDDNGISFSGGERQRLAIARVFASEADVYILDEPTSSLDPISEEKINKLIIDKAADKTIVIIAHRLSTVVDADLIYLIRDGKVMEEGTHKELMNLRGRYYEMFTTQKSLYELEKEY